MIRSKFLHLPRFFEYVRPRALGGTNMMLCIFWLNFELLGCSLCLLKTVGSVCTRPAARQLLLIGLIAIDRRSAECWSIVAD